MPKKIINSASMRVFLRETLIARCKQNPKYSLRAFAQQLRVEPSALSKIIRAERQISAPMFWRICHRLNLNPTEVEKFSENPQHNNQFNELNQEQFQVISQWYHYAILELMQIEDFVADNKWIAKALNVNINEINLAVLRLQEVGLLEIDVRGRWRSTSGNNTTLSNHFTNSAFQLQQKQILAKAIEAMDKVDFKDRSQTSVTIACDSDLVGEVKIRIKKFQRELIQFIESEGRPKNVFHLSVSFYPVTGIGKDLK